MAEVIAIVSIVAALQHVNLTIVPDEYQAVLPTLALGRLLSLYRELEFSADRAGLLCCQDAEVAYQAMLRQLHGLNAASTWIDPHKPEFDPQKYLRAIEDWEDQPLVKFIQQARQYTSQSPFVPERIAQLAVWVKSPEYRQILSRTGTSAAPDPDQLVTIDTLTIQGVADREGEVNPYVIAYSDGKKLFHTSTADGLKSVRWQGINQTRRILDNQPVFFEIWSDGTFSDTFIGGFVIYPRKPKSMPDEPQSLRANIEWDWKTRVETSRLGSANVLLKYSTRTKDTK